ncbi:MCE family protein [Actinomadura sp. HBU206391]|uniref:MCE family protein n=1 Tax=Actinomadura sp. HBU206391 TaxID=2731692 RepID=UPI001650201D|nr:MlaD family protein [Actinomadura sp. HBU206391]MBC6461606.1 MCE family protein [Actinomadura sp. HBU206391]
MLTLGTKLKNLAFLVLGVVVIAYIGSNYADLGRFFGMRGYYVVKLDLGETGGLYPGADVTYRGVSVGRVGALDLTADGVQARLHIDDSAPRIPTSVQAVVANLSAVGEQYVDLRPATGSGPFLADGALVPRHVTQTPPPVTQLLTSVDALAASVPLDSLRTVVDELGQAFQGQGPNLQVLLDTSGDLTRAASDAAPETTRLIVDGQTVLRTQTEMSEALVSFGRDARLLARRLRESDPDLRRLIETAPQAAQQVTGLLRDTDPSLSVMLANLLTTSDVALTRQNGLEELLVRLPAVAAAGSTAINSKGARFGMALTFFKPLPCTAGYRGTTYRNGLDLSPARPPNTSARCTLPPSSGVNVRGSANAPRGGGVPDPARPGSLGLTTMAGSSLPGALGLPALPPGPGDMGGLLGLPRGTDTGAERE